MHNVVVFSQWSVEKAAEINAHLLDHVHLCPPKTLKARRSILSETPEIQEYDLNENYSFI